MGDEEKSVEAQRDNSISKPSWVEITNDGIRLNRNISVYQQDCDGNVYLKSDDVNVEINDGIHLKEVESNTPLSTGVEPPHNVQRNTLKRNDNENKSKKFVKLKNLSSSKRNIGKLKKHAKDVW